MKHRDFLIVFFRNPREAPEKNWARNFVPYTPFIVVKECIILVRREITMTKPEIAIGRAELSSVSGIETQGGCCVWSGDDLPNCRWRAHRIRTFDRATHTYIPLIIIHPSPSIPRCICPRVNSLPGGDSIRDSYRSRGFARSHYSWRIMCAKQKSQRSFHREIRNYVSIRNIYIYTYKSCKFLQKYDV